MASMGRSRTAFLIIAGHRVFQMPSPVLWMMQPLNLLSPLLCGGRSRCRSRHCQSRSIICGFDQIFTIGPWGCGCLSPCKVCRTMAGEEELTEKELVSSGFRQLICFWLIFGFGMFRLDSRHASFCQSYSHYALGFSVRNHILALSSCMADNGLYKYSR